MCILKYIHLNINVKAARSKKFKLKVHFWGLAILTSSKFRTEPKIFSAAALWLPFLSPSISPIKCYQSET